MGVRALGSDQRRDHERGEGESEEGPPSIHAARHPGEVACRADTHKADAV